MHLATIAIPVGIAGLIAASEYGKARNSKWDVLAKKFRYAGTPPNGWRGCRFLRVEIQEGNRMRLTNYNHGYKKNALDFLFAKMFPKVFVSTGPAGLYLKRQP